MLKFNATQCGLLYIIQQATASKYKGKYVMPTFYISVYFGSE